MFKERQKQPTLPGKIPLIVITAVQSGELSDPDEQERQLNQADMTKLSGNSKQIIAKESSHHIHIDQPDLVVEAITHFTSSGFCGFCRSHFNLAR